MNKISVLGIDLAKNVFQLCGLNHHGKTVYHKRVSRKQLLSTVSNLDCEHVVMESCSTSHYWGRQLRSLSIEVTLLPPQHVKPFVKGNKNDRNDAVAIARAYLLGEIQPVAIKTEAQQAMRAVHSTRQLINKQRTAVSNAIRALLSEFGISFRVGDKALRAAVEQFLGEGHHEAMLIDSVALLYEQYKLLNQSRNQLDDQIKRAARADEQTRKLMAVEGIGPITATAYVSTVGDPAQYHSGRQLGAWLGLTPAHKASGNQLTPLGISKRGDTYLRYLLVHGARATLKAAKQVDKPTANQRWALAIEQRRHPNVAAVALANKNARILWALLKNGEDYRLAA